MASTTSRSPGRKRDPGEQEERGPRCLELQGYDHRRDQANTRKPRAIQEHKRGEPYPGGKNSYEGSTFVIDAYGQRLAHFAGSTRTDRQSPRNRRRSSLAVFQRKQLAAEANDDARHQLSAHIVAASVSGIQR